MDCSECCLFIAQGFVKRGPSSKFMHQFHTLGSFEGDGGDRLETCLRGAQCSFAVKVLQEASSKAIATLQEKTCSEDSLQDVVAAVYRAIEEVLYLSTENGVGKRVVKEFCRARPLEDDHLADVYENSLQMMKLPLLLAMQTICEASAEALEKGALTDDDYRYNDDPLSVKASSESSFVEAPLESSSVKGHSTKVALD